MRKTWVPLLRDPALPHIRPSVYSHTLSVCYQGFISFTLEELKGVPKDVVSGYNKRTENGVELYDVTHKTPDIFPVVSPISVPRYAFDLR